MFSSKYYNRYVDDHFDRQYYGARLKMKKFDTDEFQSLSTVTTDVHSAHSLATCVDVRDVCFHYSSFNPILNKISLQVPQGKIYALLGASGCGKTTLLRMILGRLRPLNGFIRVFGHEPGSNESRIPGPGVGYMPQELALFKHFTINEVLFYYGRLYGMHPSTIHDRVQNFITLLNLPTKHRLISQLSGGQQRRVSLAVTLIHQPPLLILDEPTVGVDSMLRCKIWNYLEELCKLKGTTVIITTHYTEEARNAYQVTNRSWSDPNKQFIIFFDKVGFIDSGTLLAQDNPQKLLHKYNCISLEDVFLELCLEKSRQTLTDDIIEEVDEDNIEQGKMNDEGIVFTASSNDHNNNASIDLANSETNNGGHPQISAKKRSVKKSASNGFSKSESVVPVLLSADQLTLTNKNSFQITKYPGKILDNGFNGSSSVLIGKPARHCRQRDFFISFDRLFALLKKNYILFKRNPVSIILLNILPILQISLYCLSFARNPRQIPVAVVNHDNKSTSLSNLFIKNIDNDTLKLIPYRKTHDAIESIHKVNSWMAITFPANFTRNFKRRFTRPEKVTNKHIHGSRILVYPDNTHSVFALYSIRVMLDTFESFVKQVAINMGMNPSYFESPIQLMEPVYGKYQINYSEAMTAGMILSIVHGMTMLIGSFSIVTERNEGHIERGFVAGIKPPEIIFSHIIFFILPVVSQVTLTLGLTFFVYQLPYQGSLAEMFVISLLEGLQGMIFGIAISLISPTEVASLIFVFSIEMPLIFTSGTLWPLESLPDNIRNLLMWNPLTLPINSLRNILLRGWSFGHFSVMVGLISSVSYTFLVAMCSFIFFEVLNCT